MKKGEYYSLREDIGIQEEITKRIKVIDDIIETYHQTKTMTLQEVKDFLWDRYLLFNERIEKRLNVE